MDVDETYHCFRCRGMAVIDKKSLTNLPETLWKAAGLLTRLAGDADVIASAQVEAERLAEELSMYSTLIESMPDD